MKNLCFSDALCGHSRAFTDTKGLLGYIAGMSSERDLLLTGQTKGYVCPAQMRLFVERYTNSRK